MTNIFEDKRWFGCDSFEALADRPILVGGLARLSIISAISHRPNLLQGGGLAPNFQSRMLTGNLASSPLWLLAQNADKIDLMLLDGTDEWLGIHKFLDNTFISRSQELAGVLVLVQQLKLLRGGIRPAKGRPTRLRSVTSHGSVLARFSQNLISHADWFPGSRLTRSSRFALSLWYRLTPIRKGSPLWRLQGTAAPTRRSYAQR